MKLLTLICFFCCSTLNAQVLHIQTAENEEQFTLSDLVLQKDILSIVEKKWLNYNPVVPINQEILLPLSTKNLSQASIFTVYQPIISNKESAIWAIQENQQDQLLLTTERMVDFTQVKFMNFLDNQPLQPKINAYQHHLKEFPAAQFVLGAMPTNKELPVNQFNGYVGEIILFDHFLSPEKKKQIETFLALKYSIPLDFGVNYTDSKNRILFDAKKETIFRSRLAGIGKDSKTGLNQKQSQSKIGSGYLSIGLGQIAQSNKENQREILDLDYLIWGDNNEPITFEKISKKVSVLKRQWKLFNHTSHNYPLSLQLDHSGIISDIDEQENLWVVIGQSDSDHFSLEQKSAIPLALENGLMVTDSFQFLAHQNGYFTFYKAPKLWSMLETQNPNCGENNGSISFKIFGGTAPYTYSIFYENNEIEKFRVLHTNEITSLHNLRAGKYKIKIFDQSNTFFEQVIFLNSSEIPKPDIDQQFFLSESHSQKIDASLKMPEGFNYRWTMPNEEVINQAEINLNSTGYYTLLIEKDNCTFQQEIEVISVAENIKDLNISPNPTGSGYIQLTAQLRDAFPYLIQIIDLQGRKLFEQDFSSEKFISWNHYLPESGVYLVSLSSGTSIQTRKIIVATP